MAYSLEIRDGDKCIAYLLVEDISKVTWNVRKVTKSEDFPDAPVYTKAKQVQPFWLFVKDLQYQYNVRQSKAKSIAEAIWPESCDREEYIKISMRLKSEIRDIGWAKIESHNAFSAETVTQIQKYLDSQWVILLPRHVIRHLQLDVSLKSHTKSAFDLPDMPRQVISRRQVAFEKHYNTTIVISKACSGMLGVQSLWFAKA